MSRDDRSEWAIFVIKKTSCNVLSWTTGETAAGDVTGFSLGDACIPVSETVALDVSIPSQCGVFS